MSDNTKEEPPPDHVEEDFVLNMRKWKPKSITLDDIFLAETFEPDGHQKTILIIGKYYEEIKYDGKSVYMLKKEYRNNEHG